jgi:hypothetical protein
MCLQGVAVPGHWTCEGLAFRSCWGKTPVKDALEVCVFRCVHLNQGGILGFSKTLGVTLVSTQAPVFHSERLENLS